MNLQDAYTDFILSREIMNVTQQTLGYYEFILSRTVDHLGTNDIENVEYIKAFHIRFLLKDLPLAE